MVTFAKAIRRHAECPDHNVEGDTLGAVLSAYFHVHPGARAYVLDERGAIRRHIAVFINDDLVTDRDLQSDPVAPADRVSVFQALSGGAQ
ncbi:MAG TPA: MoaD/ThiS family protein [Ilumatobacter sp.]|nr:MoaD/ThiS family protein [Ilumatobacter sp.]